MPDLFGPLPIPIPAPATPDDTAGDPLLDILGAFFQATLNAYAGDAWKSLKGPGSSQPVRFVFTGFDPKQRPFSDARLPALFLFRSQEEPLTEWMTQDWYTVTSRVSMAWVYPGATPEHQTRRDPFANAVSKVLRIAAIRGRDPSWVMPGDAYPFSAADVQRYGSVLANWTKLVKPLDIGRVRRETVDIVDDNGRPVAEGRYTALTCEIEVCEKLSRDPSAYGTAAVVDVTFSYGSRAPATAPAAPPAQPIAWLDASFVTLSSGLLVSAQNLSPYAPAGSAWTPGAAGPPVYQPTGFAGGPGVVWPGDHTRKLIAPIAPSFGGAPPSPGTSFTSIVAVQNGMPQQPKFGTILETYRTGDVNSGYQVAAEQSVGLSPKFFLGLERFDDAAAQDATSDVGGGNVPCVLTTIYDAASGIYTIRVNGIVIATSTTVTTGNMLAQDFVVVGAVSDAEEAFYGDAAPFVGALRTATVFPSALSADDVNFWENAVAKAAGIDIASTVMHGILRMAASIAPLTGSAGGGFPVTIFGSGFLPGASVTMGGLACTGVVVLDQTMIAALAPASAAGVVDVVVTNLTGESDTITAAFTYA